MAEIWRQKYNGPCGLICADYRPTVKLGSLTRPRAVTLDVAGPDGVYTIELTADECARITALIGPIWE